MRNRRLHKKLHTGEFQHFGFEVSFTLAKPWFEAGMEQLYDNFVFEAIEQNGLSCGGGIGAEGPNVARFFVDKIRPQKKHPWKLVHTGANEDDRKHVEIWLAAQADIVDYTVSPLVDAWHPLEP